MNESVAHSYSRSVSQTIGLVHFLLGIMVLAVFSIAVLLDGTLPLVSSGSIALFLFALSGLCQLQLKLMNSRVIWVIAAADIFLFVLAVYSLSGFFSITAALPLEMPGFAFVFALIALQALRRSPALVLFAAGIAMGARLISAVALLRTETEKLDSELLSAIYVGEGAALLALLLFAIFLGEVLKTSDERRLQRDTAPEKAGQRTEPVLNAKPDAGSPSESEQGLAENEALSESPAEASFRAAPDVGAPADVRRMRVLVAEDSQVNMMVLEKMLPAPNFELHMAEDGQEALNLFKRLYERQMPPDVVLLDIEMPYMSGHEVARAIRSFEVEHNLPRRPVIAVTALSDSRSIQESRESGMNDHLIKPVRKDLLLTSISRSLALSARDSR